MAKAAESIFTPLSFPVTERAPPRENTPSRNRRFREQWPMKSYTLRVYLSEARRINSGVFHRALKGYEETERPFLFKLGITI